MEIKKADSKGRVSGFTPGTYYEIYEAGNKTYFAIYQYGFSVGKGADMGTAEDAERPKPAWLKDSVDQEGFESTVEKGQW